MPQTRDGSSPQQGIFGVRAGRIARLGPICVVLLWIGVAIAQSATQVLLIRVSDRVGKGIRSSPRDALIADSVPPSTLKPCFTSGLSPMPATLLVIPLRIMLSLPEQIGRASCRERV